MSQLYPVFWLGYLGTATKLWNKWNATHQRPVKARSCTIRRSRVAQISQWGSSAIGVRFKVKTGHSGSKCHSAPSIFSWTKIESPKGQGGWWLMIRLRRRSMRPVMKASCLSWDSIMIAMMFAARRSPKSKSRSCWVSSNCKQYRWVSFVSPSCRSFRSLNRSSLA